MKKLIICSSLIVVVVLLAEAYRENLSMDWQHYQKEYKKELISLAKTPQEKETAQQFKIKMRQLVLPELNRVDRCVICHVAIEDDRMKDMPNPLKPHPAPYLQVHELERVGCTICHDGQGQAITFENALAHGHDQFWEKPALLEPFLEANCYRCHNIPREQTPHYNKGKELFESTGCLGCHQINGKGGTKGPDLSHLGDASFHVKMPTPENREELLHKFNGNVNLAYIYEAVKAPHDQPAESSMIDYHFSEEQAIDLTVFLKSLTSEEIPRDLISKKMPLSVPTIFERGERLYGQYCSACHGADGLGTHHKELTMIGPAIANKEFLAIAESDLIEHVISYSRGAEMPAFKTTGGLSEDEIKDIVLYIKSLKQTPPSFEEVMTVEGNAQYGAVFFQGNCASCHGIDGKHQKDLIGPTLNNSTLLGLATKRFWYDTIVGGRPGTAMPAWHYLKKEHLADLIAFLENLKPDLLDKERTIALAMDLPHLEHGEKLYEGHCASCHGFDGEGSIAPSLNNQEFHRISDAEFIFRVMTEGREGTAMASWNHLSEEDAADIIAYIKSWQKGDSVALSHERIIGSEREGEIVFKQSCAVCHGLRAGSMLAPAILSKGFLRQTSDQHIKVTTMLGRPGTQMRASLKGKGGINELSKAQINAVVAYIRSFEDDPIQLEGRALIHGEAKWGRDLFQRHCGQCHGTFGEGGVGPAIGKGGFLSSVSDGFIYAMVRTGRPGTEMKPFTMHGDGFSNLDEREVSDIIAFLRSDLNEADQHQKKVRGVPSRGKELFEMNCKQCHGVEGKGGIAPDLNNNLFLEVVSDSYLQATMSLGRHGTQMRPMMIGGGGVVELTSQEVNDIISYLRSLVQKDEKE